MNQLNRAALIMILATLRSAPGCASQPENPTFPISIDAAKKDLARMSEHPRRLDRPLVIITGFMDPGFATLALQGQFRDVTHDSPIAAISMFECMSFERCRGKVIEVVDRAFPTDDPNQTSEVDVIGFSMGGLVARLAADPPPGAHRRLRIHRLFTIDSPNQGADRAKQLPLLHPLQAGMRPGSAMLVRLNSIRPSYQIFSYVRLGDVPIGPPNAAVPGCPMWWVPTPPFSNPHVDAQADPRIRDDIARRLRGEMPIGSLPPAPLPPKAN
jgi:pimeloyl-ACP methyl ester carboxylesterase